MPIVILYETKSGNTNSWVTDENKLDHILQICDAKELKVLEIDYLVGESQ